MMGSAPSLLLVTRVTMVSVSVLFVMVSVTLPNWVGTAGNWNSLSAPPTGSGCLTLMTILELGGCGSGWTKWAGIIAWNCSLVTCFGTSSAADCKATAFLAVGTGDGSTFPLFLSGDVVRNCWRADWLTLGELSTHTTTTTWRSRWQGIKPLFHYLVVRGDDIDPIKGDVGKLESPV